MIKDATVHQTKETFNNYFRFMLKNQLLVLLTCLRNCLWCLFLMSLSEICCFLMLCTSYSLFRYESKFAVIVLNSLFLYFRSTTYRMDRACRRHPWCFQRRWLLFWFQPPVSAPSPWRPAVSLVLRPTMLSGEWVSDPTLG